MPEPAAVSSLTRHPSFMLFWCARTFTNGAFMMQGVAVGWQIYDLTHDPFDLGLVGLMQFIPLVVMAVIVGPGLDLFDRPRIAAAPPVAEGLPPAAPAPRPA